MLCEVSELIHFTVRKHSYEALLAGTQRELYLPINELNAKRVGTAGMTASVRFGNLCARYAVVAVDCGFGNPNWGANKHTQYVRVHVTSRQIEETTLKQEELWSK